MTTAQGAPRLIFSGAATMDLIYRVRRLPSGGGKILPYDLIEVAHGMASSRLLKKGFYFWLGRDSVCIRNGAAGCAELTNGRERYSVTSTLKREFEPTIRCA